MNIVKIQNRKKDTIITIPSGMLPVLGNAEYMNYKADEKGLHYTPVEG